MPTRHPRGPYLLLCLALLLLPTAASAAAPEEAETKPLDARIFVLLLSPEREAREEALELIETHWRPGFPPMLLETRRFVRDPSLVKRLRLLLEKKTGKRLGSDLDAWLEWWWNTEDATVDPGYEDFKVALYRLIDPRFAAYFEPGRASTIRLDEVVWGGVVQDGIPPLRGPKMIPAKEAKYLEDDHIVFGLELDGDARAYPKRILAWHEMFVDTVGGVEVAGVYCTLCGSMIVYETHHDGTRHELGTSGFLYRSNKLMYDRATQSLWNTLWGRPVHGPLVGKGIELTIRGVVTTTWGDWKRRHPHTTVLSLDTGYDRDYGEGVAYRDYFATDQLMFPVPQSDRRLDNKDEVFALVGEDEAALALSSRFLAKNPLHHETFGDEELVILTDTSDAHRAYRTGGLRFESWDGESIARDVEGKEWRLEEHGLVGPEGSVLERRGAHRAFWFGWYAAYPETRLVK
jgi:hypothetical protein